MVTPVRWTHSPQFPQMQIDTSNPILSPTPQCAMEHIPSAIIISSTVRRIYAHETFSKFPQDRIAEVTVLSLKERDIFKVLDT